MRALEMMSKPVISVSPWTSIARVVQLLRAEGLSGAPVLDRGQLVGIVSAGDFLHRHEIGTDRRHIQQSWFLRLFSSDAGAAHYVRTHCVRIHDIMTTRVVTVNAQADLDEVADTLDQHHVGRVPVTQCGQVVGIISRSDILRALASRASQVDSVPSYSDVDIQQTLLRELTHQEWWRSQWSAFDVHEGVVAFRGLVSSDIERRAARVAAENIPGVRYVKDHRLATNLWVPMI